jgi:hypothetical protein
VREARDQDERGKTRKETLRAEVPDVEADTWAERGNKKEEVRLGRKQRRNYNNKGGFFFLLGCYCSKPFIY